MTNNRAKMRRQREQLFREQCGRCYWCGVYMVMPAGLTNAKPLSNTATIEHLFSRLHPDRGRVRGRTHVLACWDCNNKRARLEDAALPIQERWRRADAYPLAMQGLPEFS